MKASVVSELARTVLAQRYDQPKPTPDFHEELWELCCMDHNQVVIAAPRGHAKTTAITGSYTIAKIVFRESDYVVVVSDTEGQAVEFLAELKLEFLENDHLIELFKVKRLKKDAEKEVIIEFLDGHLCRIVAKGAEQKIRGRKWRGKRPNLFIIDDLENEELTDSDERREKLRRWFYGTLLPAGGDNCLYRMVGTVLHFDSLLENLLPNENDKNTVIEDLRTYNVSLEDDEWLGVKYRAHNPDFSKILWEEKFPEKRLKAKKADYVRRGIPEVYSQEYLNEPLSDDNAFFEKRDFRPYSEEIKQHFLNKTDGWPTYIAADLAISQAKRAAFTVMVVCKMGPDGKIYVADLIRGRWDANKIIEKAFGLVELWNPETFWMEAENIQRTLGPIFEREMRDRNLYFTLEGITPTRDKQSRARPLQARMRAGAVLFDLEAEWYIDCEQELRRFPKSPYKDQVDALSLMAFSIDDMSDPLTERELEEQEYEEEFGDFYLGRDGTTGY